MGSVAVSGAALPHSGASLARNCSASRRFAADVCRVTLRERERERESKELKQKETRNVSASEEKDFCRFAFFGFCLVGGLGGF